MSSLEFEDPQFHYRTIDISGAVTHNTPYLIRWKIVKDIKTANVFMGIVVIACIVASLIIFNQKTTSERKKYRQDYTQNELDHMLPDMVNALPSKPQ